MKPNISGKNGSTVYLITSWNWANIDKPEIKQCRPIVVTSIWNVTLLERIIMPVWVNCTGLSILQTARWGNQAWTYSACLFVAG
jgi:hypothetical protein